MPKRRRPVDRLPNAPLAEVVFEIRWKLQGNVPFVTDPGLLPLTAAFTARAAKLGFPSFKDMARPEEVVGHSVIRRFYTAPDVTFPILQIGSGVFASNQSSDYVWPSFRSQALKGLKLYLDSYPKMEAYPLEPVHLELRYIDVFDESLLGTLDLVEFASRGTALKIEIPDSLFDKKVFTGPFEGRLLLQKQMKSGMNFVVDFASARRAPDGEKMLRLESKAVMQAGIPKFRGAVTFMRAVDKWLQEAHDLTSPFFKRFMTSEVMRKFN
jgi:uncharacterized protein (TIGR04255 family)